MADSPPPSDTAPPSPQDDAHPLDPRLPADFDARTLFPWWFRWVNGDTVERAPENPIFRATLRRAVALKRSPKKIIREDGWFRCEGGAHHLIRDLWETEQTSEDVIEGAWAAGAIPGRAVRSAFGTSFIEKAWHNFLFPFLVIVIVGLLIYDSNRDIGVWDSGAMERLTQRDADYMPGENSEIDLGSNLLLFGVMAVIEALFLFFLLNEDHAWFVLRRLFKMMPRRLGSYQYWLELLLNRVFMTALIFACVVILGETGGDVILAIWGFWRTVIIDGIGAFIIAPKEQFLIVTLATEFVVTTAFGATFIALFIGPRISLQKCLEDRIANEMRPEGQ